LSGQQVIKPQITVADNHFLACVLSPGIPHVEKNNGKFNRYYAVMIEKDFLEKVYDSYTKNKITEFIWHQFTVDMEIVFYIKQFIYEYENKPDNCDVMLQNLTNIITHKIVRSLLEGEKGKEPVLCEFGIEKAKQYLQQNFGKKIKIERLAQIANMSVSHFDRTFKNEYGCSPFQYLMNIRIEKAKKYLKNKDERITNIALLCGFSSASSFSASFHKSVGMKPMEYRKMYEIQCK
jgi:AraC-like DNA-binding protein